MNNFHELVINRRSYRRYTDELLTPDQVRLILEAALMSPAGKRKNPWHFVVVEDRETLRQLSLVKDAGAAPLADAALAIVVCADPEESDTWVEDCAIASIQMQLQCADLGLGSVWIQMRNRYDENGNTATYNIRQILSIPANYEVLSAISIGHPDEVRKPYDTDKLQWEKVHIGKF
ncbi:MAG: nitroreductase family protein [Bacteroidales bacterium]|nr:nitroreductase family protein [Candidatus Liminaster caballi]